MNNQLKGFVEGTTHVTTGDKMKLGDHRRDKRNCYFYNNDYCECLSQKCTGSSHCDYYNDGIKVNIIEPTIPNLHTHEILLMSFLQNLRNEINYDSLEGNCIRITILNKHHLTKEDIENAKKQNKDFECKKASLIKEINDYNEKLKNKCILIGLLVITAPFCYAYYQNNFRKEREELASLRRKIINNDLQRKVEQYNADLKEYQELSQTSKPKKAITDEEEEFFVRARHAYNAKDFERFFEMILKSIKVSHNISAIVYLAKLFKSDTLFEKNIPNYILLHSYASYLGHKDSSRTLGDLFLRQNSNSRLGRKFLEKADKH